MNIARREFVSMVAAGAAAQALHAEPERSKPLTPKTTFGGRKLEFDFPSLHIGAAEYDEGPTGCTVFYFPDGAQCATDVRGGSPGVFMGGDGYVDAISLAGGSLYGLEAATGVAAELLAMRKGSTAWNDIALVRGAIVYDFRLRSNAIYPDKDLGRAALRAARAGVFHLGGRGVGRNATVGKAFDASKLERGGQGGAFRQIGPTKVAVFTVVNAVGVIVNREGKVVRGQKDPATGKHSTPMEEVEKKLAPTPEGNTTLTIVVTNQKLDSRPLTAFARQVHSSMARAIQPFHAWNDGDVLFGVTTNEVANPKLDVTALGVVGSELAWDAVLNCFD